MTVEGGVRDPGISRATLLDLSPWAPQDSSQGFLAYLPVDTMHKSESCDLLFYSWFVRRNTSTQSQYSSNFQGI
jgi:hypothetical protein